MASEKGHIMIPMTSCETYPQPNIQAPSAPDFCAQEVDYQYPSPPPYSYQDVNPTANPTETVYIVSQPPIVVAGIFTSKPASTICPSCRQAITTQVVYRLGKLSYLLCSGMCATGCCLGCCLIPLVLKACKDVDHYCPRCQFHIFRYKRI
ncbi:lipopolysaccharide-induced tumor necrosis factor-alpha factor homolog [Alligator sinensis]|nr:lipopolysaccharide-induced tumor necrosis factor-alpha factor homolog [Alligator sinensis]